MPSLSLRVNLDHDGRLGPGKVALLEEIGRLGSISAAARAMDMSYKRAWDLIENLNSLFGKPLIATRAGGKRGGGAELTEAGRVVVDLFRGIERDCASVAERQLRALQDQIG